MTSERTNTNWWQTFFTSGWLNVHEIITRDKDTASEADLIEKLLELDEGARVLDVPCGEGRLSIEMARRGYNVTGVDKTRELLDSARHKTRRRDLDVTWEHRDMRELPWEAEFDGAFNYWGSFGYFDDAGNREFVEAVARALKPGGRFIIETPTVETLLPKFQPRGWSQLEDVILLEERKFDHERSRIDATWTFIRDGERQQATSSIRLYTYRELCALLQEAGFTNCAGYDAEGEPFSVPGSGRLVMVAEK